MVPPALHRMALLAMAVLTLVGMPIKAGEPPTAQRSVIQHSDTPETELSATERRRAEHWALSPGEWRRYRALMEGIRGQISPSTLSPIEVLGIHARDAAERRRYAEQWAILMREDAERILAFQGAYDAAVKRLFPDERLIDVARLPRVSKEPPLLPSDRVMLFVRPDCSACDVVLERLLRRLDRVAGIDIYLSAVEDEETVRDWAAERDIEPQWVHDRRVTLNLDAGTLAELVNGPRVLPVLLRRRGDSVTPLRAGVL